MLKETLKGIFLIYLLFGLSLILQFSLDIYYGDNIAKWIVYSWLDLYQEDILKFIFLTFGVPLFSTLLGMNIGGIHKDM